MSGQPQLDVNSVNAPPPGSGGGYDFLDNSGSNNQQSASLFGEPAQAPPPTTVAPGGPPSGDASRKATKPVLEPAEREDFSAEAMEKRAMEQRTRMHEEQQRRAAYQSTVQAYNSLVPAPPAEPLWKRFQPYAVYITLVVALLLLFLFFWTRKKATQHVGDAEVAAATS